MLEGAAGKRSGVDKRDEVVRRLLKVAGTTYAAEAGVKIHDKPMPLFQLLVLCMLASKPIDAAVAMSADRELFKAGLRSPKAVLASDRRTMISAFGRAHYVRYDESSATRLTDMAERVRDEYHGDLREMAESCRHDVAAAKRMLKRFKGIGDTGADIYLREVQDVWPWVRPYFDGRATAAARQLGLPAQPAKLGALAPRANARLAAALVRASLDDDVRRQVAG
ncbi:endonuclease [Mycobacterium sp. 1245805.9]|uniref:endonuclease n=1 Tax=Mycobacterium sp. 1245805.9 TaxID=1856862 RepID=UPI003514EF36